MNRKMNSNAAVAVAILLFTTTANASVMDILPKKPITAKSLVEQYKPSVPSPTVFTNIPFGQSFVMGLPWCAATAPIVYTAIVKRPMTLQEAHETFASCILPFVGGWIVRDWYNHHPKWKNWKGN